LTEKRARFILSAMKKKEPHVQVQTFTVTRKVTLEEKACAQCNKRFVGRKNKQYCSLACARKASYWRNPEAYRESRLRSYRKQKEQEAKA
jgi:hypothetical protein